MPKKTSFRYRRSVRLDGDRRKVFLQHLRKTGLLWVSADLAGVSGYTVKLHMKDDEDFRTQVEEAMNLYRDSIESEIHRRGIEGVDEPVFHQGIKVALVRKFSDRMLELHAKRHIAAYRDKVTADVNMGGGVLVVTGKPESAEEWAKKYGNERHEDNDR